MAFVVLLGPANGGIKILLQTGGQRPLPLDLHQRAFFRCAQTLLGPLGILAQLVQFPGKVRPGLCQRGILIATFTLQPRDVALQGATRGVADRPRLLQLRNPLLRLRQRRTTLIECGPQRAPSPREPR
jgi:hypothetical protein